jgi:hypothetical protein
MRKLLLSWLLISFLRAEIYEIPSFESDIFSKNSLKLKPISLSIVFEGEDLTQNRLKLKDSLNVLISSFYLEDLFTSKGKERFKNSLKKYLYQKYSLKIDSIYIKELKRDRSSIEMDELIEALKREGCCKKDSTKAKKLFESIEGE